MTRIKLLKFSFLIFLFIIIVRLFYWQILNSDNLTARAEQQHLVTQNLDAPRGVILSSDGSLLVSNKPTYTLFGNPKIVKNKTDVAKSLAKIMIFNQSKGEEIDPSEIINLKNDIFERLSSNLNWVPLSKNIELATKEEIEKLKIDGIGFEAQSNRFYPESSSSAHLLGFVGSDSLGRQVGYFGIEGFYDGQLRGIGGVLTEEKDAEGLPILMGKFLQKEPKNGHNLTLNIDRAVQYIVEKKLKAGVEKYGAKSGSVVIIEPKSGAILAMASYPNYDPGNFSNFPKEYYKNPVVAESYEPGSTFKVLVMASAINENVLKADTKCDICDRPVKASDYLIRTWNNKYYPDTSMTDVIVHSDNTGMVFVSRKLGLDKFYQYIENFGFGSLTGVDLQDETSPDIRVKNEWRDIDLATASFGQGIAVTPLQTVRAVGSIANGGYLMEPHIVKYIDDGNKIIEIKPKIIKRVLSEETTKIVTEMMVQAVEKGEAKSLAPKRYKIAGKTGTAQIPVAGHYDPEKTVASFVGFAPANDPKFVMLVKYNEPSSSIYGADTAAPTFFDITKELLTYYNIAPN